MRRLSPQVEEAGYIFLYNTPCIGVTQKVKKAKHRFYASPSYARYISFPDHSTIVICD